MKKETQVYQWVAIICFSMMIAVGWKYTSLKDAYQTAVEEKNEFCIKYYEATCK